MADGEHIGLSNIKNSTFRERIISLVEGDGLRKQGAIIINNSEASIIERGSGCIVFAQGREYVPESGGLNPYVVQITTDVRAYGRGVFIKDSDISTDDCHSAPLPRNCTSYAQVIRSDKHATPERVIASMTHDQIISWHERLKILLNKGLL